MTDNLQENMPSNEGTKGKVQTKNFSETYAVFDLTDIDAIADHIKDKLSNSDVKDANITFKMKLIVAE